MGPLAVLRKVVVQQHENGVRPKWKENMTKVQKLADWTFTDIYGHQRKRYTVRSDPMGGFGLWDQQCGRFLYSPFAPYATREEAWVHLQNTTKEEHEQQRKLEFINKTFDRGTT